RGWMARGYPVSGVLYRVFPLVQAVPSRFRTAVYREAGPVRGPARRTGSHLGGHRTRAVTPGSDIPAYRGRHVTHLDRGGWLPGLGDPGRALSDPDDAGDHRRRTLPVRTLRRPVRPLPW